MESARFDRLGRDAVDAGEPRREGKEMATKDKGTRKAREKKPAQKTLKEKRQARKAKK